MCNRQKPISAKEIQDISFEMKTRAESLTRLVNKLNRQGYLTEDEKALAREHTDFIENNKATVKNFYKPAIVID